MANDAVAPSPKSPWWWNEFDQNLYDECWDEFGPWVDWLPNCEHSVRQAIFPAPVAYHTDYGRQTTVPGFHAG